MKKNNDFAAGILYAAQFVAINHGQDTIASSILRESGYKKSTFLNLQKATQFETRKMNEIIRSAFKMGGSRC